MMKKKTHQIRTAHQNKSWIKRVQTTEICQTVWEKDESERESEREKQPTKTAAAAAAAQKWIK